MTKPDTQKKPQTYLKRLCLIRNYFQKLLREANNAWSVSEQPAAALAPADARCHRCAAAGAGPAVLWEPEHFSCSLRWLLRGFSSSTSWTVPLWTAFGLSAASCCLKGQAGVLARGLNTKVLLKGLEEQIKSYSLRCLPERINAQPCNNEYDTKEHEESIA